ncbi:histidine phosphatase superfamily [Kockiozyma suomiensis]|uniref:histidine phosphatase superfamily n=1 Tax=Kockiozyma suomiensis TaxID=1337062 RepID=UPI0033437913
MTLSIFSAVLAGASVASAAYTLDGITHYPPVNNSFNSIDAVFAASSGTNGGYYNLSTVADIDYGAYNYCNMPHVRAREYEVPTGYSLQYLEIIHRHHKRTPYASNLFPYEDIPLYCDDTKMYFYAATKNGVDTSAIWWKDYMDADNPMMFVKNGFNSTCQFPQISFAGLEDSSQHGRDLWSVYGDKIHYLPKEFDPATMIVRVTNNQITSQVAGALIKGLYPDANDFTVYQQVASQDSLEPGYTCGPADDLRSAYEDTDAWFKHLNMSQDLFTALDTISGVDPTDSGWHSWFDHYFDNLSSRTCHQLPLPCNVTNATDCITQEQAEQVFRLGDYEYNYIFRQAQNATLYSATHYGAFLSELIAHLKGKISGTISTVYRHNIAHDGSIAPLLGALQIDYLRWPGMGSEVVFELWRKNNSHAYAVRVLYSGKPLSTQTPLGVLDMVDADEFIAYLEGLVGVDGSKVREFCTQ